MGAIINYIFSTTQLTRFHDFFIGFCQSVEYVDWFNSIVILIDETIIYKVNSNVKCDYRIFICSSKLDNYDLPSENTDAH